MIKFPNKKEIQKIQLFDVSNGRVKYRLTDDIKMEIWGETMVFKKGFVYDGASIPQFLWSLYPPINSKYFWSSLIHDYLYTTQKYPKILADIIFFLCVKKESNSIKLALRFYFAVAFGGKRAWNENKEKLKKKQEAVLKNVGK
jgi:hypothetical protein